MPSWFTSSWNATSLFMNSRPRSCIEQGRDSPTPQPQQEPLSLHCTGGHLRVPYEQKTQQSPARGRKTVPQFVHS